MRKQALKSVRRRALGATIAIIVGIVAVVLGYLTAVEHRIIALPLKPLKSPELVEPKLAPPVAVKALVNISEAKNAVEQVANAASSSAASPAPTSSRPASLEAAPNRVSLATNLSSSPFSAAQANVSTNISFEDERVAKSWLKNTNQRLAIRIQYRAEDVIRLATELNRGVIVAGSGTTNRREFFLQSMSGGSPVFSSFTRPLAQSFAPYTLALNTSQAFERVMGPLPAYFPSGEFDLAFVPDDALAVEIFGKVANAHRHFANRLKSSAQIVFSGELSLRGMNPTFEIVEVKSGLKRVEARSIGYGD